MPGNDRASVTRRKTLSRIGIALAGGGPLGGIYEVGASTALEEASDGLDLTQAHCYVGVSSGSFIAAALANGISPEKLANILLDDAATVFDPRLLLRPAFREYFSRLLSIPQLAGSSALTWLRDPLHHGLFESFQRLSHAIPTGLFDNRGIDDLLRRCDQVVRLEGGTLRRAPTPSDAAGHAPPQILARARATAVKLTPSKPEPR